MQDEQFVFFPVFELWINLKPGTAAPTVIINQNICFNILDYGLVDLKSIVSIDLGQGITLGQTRPRIQHPRRLIYLP